MILFALCCNGPTVSRCARPTEECTVATRCSWGLARELALAPGVSALGGRLISWGGGCGSTRAAAAKTRPHALPSTGGASLYKGAEMFRDGGIRPGSAERSYGDVAAMVSGSSAIWFTAALREQAPFLPS